MRLIHVCEVCGKTEVLTPEEAFEQASEVIHARPKNAPVKNNPPDPYVDWPKDFRNDYVGQIQQLYDQLKEGEGVEVLCQCDKLDKETLGDTKNLCKSKDATEVTNAVFIREFLGEGLAGRILICRAGMANYSASSGGCGCLVLHELLHYLGFDSRRAGADKKSDDKRIDKDIRVRDMENAMIRLARHLLRKNKKLKCGGYDYGVDVESDDVQIYGPPGKNPPAGRYLW